jgi:UDP-N-acetylmuramate--alanine ligase
MINNLLQYQKFYLVGIKGVAMTALAQCLLDAGKEVTGSDVSEEFVTQPILNNRQIKIDVGFDNELPLGTECVIYTAAHQAQKNPQVGMAQKRNIPCITHAEALASLFNLKKGIAVCGVGGKSTTSAMIALIMEKTSQKPSYAVGVGNIPGLDKTGQWDEQSEYFVAEADEYVTDPSAPQRNEEITPRFSFMKPFVTVCTNLKYDHPDVYQDYDHTKAVFATFFSQIQSGGWLLVNSDDEELVELARKAFADRLDHVLYFKNLKDVGVLHRQGDRVDAFFHQLKHTEEGTRAVVNIGGTVTPLNLKIPGEFNVMNALAALLVCKAIGVPLAKSVPALSSFQSTMRRSEYIGLKNGVRYYDDYAHHPDEVKNIIEAFKAWYPQQKLLVAFQSHTFSRTKQFFNEFVNAFEKADEVAMIDIFASARESFDEEVSSDTLCQAIQTKFVHKKAENYKTISSLAAYLEKNLQPGDICLTVGAGDIYKVHQLIK